VKGGCREDGKPCKRLFPFTSNRAGTRFNADTQRYDYFRFSEHHDQYIVPYHPQILALWQAHMNIQVPFNQMHIPTYPLLVHFYFIILPLPCFKHVLNQSWHVLCVMQRITHAEWSWYLLKYVSKAEPIGALNFNKSHLEALGLYDITDAQAQLASAAILARTISIGEAALVLAGIPLVQADVSVTYVDTRCPETRTRVCWGNHISVPACDSYFMRPVEYANFTPKQYFTLCTVRKANQPRPRNSDPNSQPVVDDAGNKVCATAYSQQTMN
jgi:hypothetical protein